MPKHARECEADRTSQPPLTDNDDDPKHQNPTERLRYSATGGRHTAGYSPGHDPRFAARRGQGNFADFQHSRSVVREKVGAGEEYIVVTYRVIPVFVAIESKSTLGTLP